jgi:S-adenosylmethionine hydrolase
MKRPLITLLTDFGTQDHYVAAMKGVILGICPNAQIIDITHDIPPFQIGAGAYTLAQAVPTFPQGAVHVAVVDPGVGSARRAIAARAGGHLFIAPDNGLLSLVPGAAHQKTVFEITNSRLFRRPVSKTFHGRDIFAPVAAHLAGGVALTKVGPRLAAWNKGNELTPQPDGSGGWNGRVLSIDRFGNIVTPFHWKDFAAVAQRPSRLRIGSLTVTDFAETFDSMPVGRVALIRGSADFLEVCLRQGSAAEVAGAAFGTAINLAFT